MSIALTPITVATEKTINEARLYLSMALCTSVTPTEEKTKHSSATVTAYPTGTRPISQNCTTDIDDEKNTIDAQVPAVTCAQYRSHMGIHAPRDRKNQDSWMRY
ncbi:unnamed protein product [Calypogeia fissa]